MNTQTNVSRETNPIVERYLNSNGHYDPIKSEMRKSEIQSTRAESKDEFNKRTQVVGLQGVLRIVNKTVRQTDALVEDLATGMNVDYIQQKQRWNSGWKRSGRKRILVKH